MPLDFLHSSLRFLLESMDKFGTSQRPACVSALANAPSDKNEESLILDYRRGLSSTFARAKREQKRAVNGPATC
jgi:hypothetical protein